MDTARDVHCRVYSEKSAVFRWTGIMCPMFSAPTTIFYVGIVLKRISYFSVDEITFKIALKAILWK